MPVKTRKLEPEMKVEIEDNTTKVVEVGVIDNKDLDLILEAVMESNFKIPQLDLSEFEKWLSELDSEIKEADQQKLQEMSDVSGVRAMAAIARVITKNMPILWDMLLRHKAVRYAVVEACSNLNREEAEHLSAADAFKVCVAGVGAARADGLFEAAQSFFGGLVGLSPSARKTNWWETETPTSSDVPSAA